MLVHRSPISPSESESSTCWKLIRPILTMHWQRIIDQRWSTRYRVTGCTVSWHWITVSGSGLILTKSLGLLQFQLALYSDHYQKEWNERLFDSSWEAFFFLVGSDSEFLANQLHPGTTPFAYLKMWTRIHRQDKSEPSQFNPLYPLSNLVLFPTL